MVEPASFQNIAFDTGVIAEREAIVKVIRFEANEQNKNEARIANILWDLANYIEAGEY